MADGWRIIGRMVGKLLVDGCGGGHTTGNITGFKEYNWDSHRLELRGGLLVQEWFNRLSSCWGGTGGTGTFNQNRSKLKLICQEAQQLCLSSIR